MNGETHLVERIFYYHQNSDVVLSESRAYQKMPSPVDDFIKPFR